MQYSRWHAQALQPLSCALYAAYVDGDAAGCLWLPNSIVSWHSPLHCIPCSLFQCFLSSIPTCFFLKHWELKWPKKKSEWPAWAYCPARPPEFILCFKPLFYFPDTPTLGLWSFSPLQSPILPFFISSGLHVLAWPQWHLLSYFASYVFSYFWILFWKSSWFTLCTILFIRLHLLSLRIIMIINLQFRSQSIQLTPLGIFFRYCPHASFTYLWILPSRRAFCCRQLRAASGIALHPMPGWASLWLPFALSTLSSLRQAKIHWADSEEGAVSRFTPFAFEMLLLEGLPRNQYLTRSGFHKKYPIKGQTFCTIC